MNVFVNTYNVLEGFHRWADAPDECSYLRARHRHMFVIRCAFRVTDEDREVEINMCQNEISSFLGRMFGTPMELGGMSCEHVAHTLMNEFDNLSQVTILEDNYGGATLSR